MRIYVNYMSVNEWYVVSSPFIPLSQATWEGNRSPVKFLVSIEFYFTPLSVVYSGQRIEDFLYSPFGGGFRGEDF